MPLVLKTGAAAGAVRNLISKLAASAFLQALDTPRPGTRDRDAARRVDFARRGEAVGQGRRQDGNVECGAFVDLLLQHRSRAESEDKLVLGRLFELPSVETPLSINRRWLFA
jgi:hypothetical protein